jgi:hypothetical protein
MTAQPKAALPSLAPWSWGEMQSSAGDRSRGTRLGNRPPTSQHQSRPHPASSPSSRHETSQTPTRSARASRTAASPGGRRVRRRRFTILLAPLEARTAFPRTTIPVTIGSTSKERPIHTLYRSALPHASCIVTRFWAGFARSAQTHDRLLRATGCTQAAI